MVGALVNEERTSVAKTSVIGLDIGTTHVRAVEMRFAAGGPGRGQATMVRCGQVALPAGAVRDGEVVEAQTVASSMRQLWSDVGFPSKDVVIGVGNQRVMVREIDLPWMPLQQLRASLPYQAQELLPMAASEALLDFYPTSETNGPEGRVVSGLFVAAVRDTVTANILACEAAGLAPTMVDINAFGLHRALVVGDVRSRTVALVDIGARITTVVISERGVPRFVRVLPAGGQDVTDAVAGAMQVTSAEAERLKREIGVGFPTPPDREAAAEATLAVTRSLVDAIRNTFAFYASSNPGSQIEMIALSGGAIHLPGLGQYLSSATRIPVTLGNPFGEMSFDKTARRDAMAGFESSFALSVGLAYGVAT